MTDFKAILDAARLEALDKKTRESAERAAAFVQLQEDTSRVKDALVIVKQAAAAFDQSDFNVDVTPKNLSTVEVGKVPSITFFAAFEAERAGKRSTQFVLGFKDGRYDLQSAGSDSQSDIEAAPLIEKAFERIAREFYRLA